MPAPLLDTDSDGFILFLASQFRRTVPAPVSL